MDLHVVRGLDVERPAAVNPAAPEAGAAAGAAPRGTPLRRTGAGRSARAAG
jgi:hypothetical protein